MDALGGDGWVREGDLAPSFELPDSKFKPVSPIGANTKVVLSFFPAAFSGSLTGGCECQMRTLNQELSSIAGNGDVGVYGIGRELPFTMSAWSEKIGLGFPLLSDATLVVAQIIDDGKVVYKWVGKNTETGRPDPSILPDIGRVTRALASGRARL